METTLEVKVAKLLSDILATQDDLLQLLSKKRELLMAKDMKGLESILPEEERLASMLQDSIVRRGELLKEAKMEGMRGTSLQSIARSLPPEQRGDLDEKLGKARAKARLLKCQSLTSWIVVQKTLLHLSQMIEVIATGGQNSPTYNDKELVGSSGGLVDRAA